MVHLMTSATAARSRSTVTSATAAQSRRAFLKATATAGGGLLLQAVLPPLVRTAIADDAIIEDHSADF